MIAAVQNSVNPMNGYLIGSKYTTVAKDAARHVQLYLITNIDLLERTLVFFVTGFSCAMLKAKILQVTFTCLVANRAIQRVIDQQHFHHTFARFYNFW